MDIDCDGDQSDQGDGRCKSSTDTQGRTSFAHKVREYGIKDLNSNKIPYIVFGNDGGSKFNPTKYGVRPLSVVAVVCSNRLVYGIWGDTNGNHPGVVGEASLSLATECFGQSMNGNSGHSQEDVLYIAFRGDEAVPGHQANWRAQSFAEFERSIAHIGDRLIQRV